MASSRKERNESTEKCKRYLLMYTLYRRDDRSNHVTGLREARVALVSLKMPSWRGLSLLSCPRQGRHSIKGESSTRPPWVGVSWCGQDFSSYVLTIGARVVYGHSCNRRSFVLLQYQELHDIRVRLEYVALTRHVVLWGRERIKCNE